MCLLCGGSTIVSRSSCFLMYVIAIFFNIPFTFSFANFFSFTFLVAFAWSLESFLSLEITFWAIESKLKSNQSKLKSNQSKLKVNWNQLNINWNQLKSIQSKLKSIESKLKSIGSKLKSIEIYSLFWFHTIQNPVPWNFYTIQ